MAAAEAGDDPRQPIGIGPVRDVHIEQIRRARRRLRQHLLDHAARHARRRVEMVPALVDLREGDRRHAEEKALHRGGHGARIQRVVAHVRALVDARHDQVGLVLQQAGQRDVNTVGRRAVDVAHAVGCRVHRQRPVQGQGVGSAAGVLLGSHHVELAEPFAGVDQGREAGGEITVVVRDQDAHRAIVGMRGHVTSATALLCTPAYHAARHPGDTRCMPGSATTRSAPTH